MNKIQTYGFSNPESEEKYRDKWPTEYLLLKKYEAGLQCGGCTFYAAFNADYGLCCAPDSRHRLETVFEHFTCASHVNEGWSAHSFSSDRTIHCEGGKCKQKPEIIAFASQSRAKPSKGKKHR